MDNEPKDLVVINTHKGLFRYTVMLFRVTSDVLARGGQNSPRAESCFYLDDNLVYGKNEDEHLQNLSAVLSRLQEAGIKLNPDKCEFLRTSVKYLGRRIDGEALHPVESKVEELPKLQSKEMLMTCVPS